MIENRPGPGAIAGAALSERMSMNDNESTYGDPADRRAIVGYAESLGGYGVPTVQELAEYTWGGRSEVPECEISPRRYDQECYPKGPTVRELAATDRRTRRLTDGQEVQLPSMAEAVVHVWNAFPGFAVELGGYGDLEMIDPYSGRRFWCPVPDQVWAQGTMAAYRYLLDRAEQAGFPVQPQPEQIADAALPAPHQQN